MIKQELRKELRKSAETISREYYESASQRISERVLASEEYRNAGCIFLYISMPGEPDTRQILADAFRTGKQVCVPRCQKKPVMEAVRIKSLEDLDPKAATHYGIPEPKSELPAADVEKIDLVLVPCVAAAGDGSRLGHGAGYYDAFLSREDVHPQTVMCLCFEKMIRNEIPTDAGDVQMDAVVTERGIYKGGKR